MSDKFYEMAAFVGLVFFLLALNVVFTGCAAMDGLYGTTKKVYIKGKEVVIQNADKLDTETLNRLERLDDYAGRYDKAREVVREGKPQTANGE